jgi:hypothetical protein
MPKLPAIMEGDMGQRLRFLGATLLLVSLALPMGSCTYFVDAKGRRVTADDPGGLPADATEVSHWAYALESFDAHEVLSWATLVAFVWPTLAAASLVWRPRGGGALAVRLLEGPLLVLSISIVDFVSTFFVNHRAFGAYAAFLALTLYLCGAVIDDVTVYRAWRQR